MARVVSPIMPPMMPVPIEWRALAPAPVAMASGKHSEDERERGHDDRPQPLLAGLDRRVHDREPLLAQIDREGDPQDRVLRPEADQHQQADLEVDIVFETAQPVEGQGAEDAEGHGRHDGAGQGPRLELGGQHEEHDDEAEDEGDARGRPRFLFLEGHARPGKAIAAGEHLVRRPLPSP